MVEVVTFGASAILFQRGRMELADGFGEHDAVVVRRLRTPTRHVMGSEGVRREPRVGDQGAIVSVLDADHFSVECVDGEGRTLWLAHFHRDELDSVTANA
jgi:hypothetical protein